MSFNGAGLFLINTAGQPVVTNTTIASAVFNAFTQDVATGLSTCITKDGQTVVTANIPLAGFKVTGLGLGTSATDAANVSNANLLSMCEFRLTLTTGVPVTTADVTSTTLYFSPYKGNRVALYDGTNWHMRTSVEISITNGGLSTSKPYDVFCYDNAGAPTLEVLVWTNDTTRATALTTQNGVLVKTGDATRRYVGTVYHGPASLFADSSSKRWLANFYNRVFRPMKANISGINYNYTTNTYRQAAGSAANGLDFVVAVAEDAVWANVVGDYRNTNANVLANVAIGLDSTTAASSDCSFNGTPSLVVNIPQVSGASYVGQPAVGRHQLNWLETSAATGTTTWNNSSSNAIFGGIWA